MLKLSPKMRRSTWRAEPAGDEENSRPHRMSTICVWSVLRPAPTVRRDDRRRRDGCGRRARPSLDHEVRLRSWQVTRTLVGNRRSGVVRNGPPVG
jgi:hypothetical protein